MALCFAGSLPKLFGKILLMSGLFFGFVFSSFGFSPTSFFFRDTGSNRTPPHALVLLVLVLFLCPAALLFCPFWQCVLLLGGFSGCHSGPRVFFEILLVLTGLELARPFRGPFLGCSKGFSWLLVLGFCFSPFVSFCGHAFSRRTGGGPTNPAGSLTHPWAGALDPPFLGILTAFFVCLRVTGTLERLASRAFCLGRGRFSLPPRRPFFTRSFFCSRSKVFFCLRGQLRYGLQDAMLARVE